MNNLDVHIVGLGNLGSALLQGLINLDKNLTFHLYEKETKILDFIKKQFEIDPRTEIDVIESGVLILCIKPKDLNLFIETNKKKDFRRCINLYSISWCGHSLYLKIS